MEGNIIDIISQYTRGDTSCCRLRFISKPHFLFSPDAMEGNIKYIISQYTRDDTPCTTCSRLRFISNLTYFSLQTLRRAILSISYRNIHEVIPCTTYRRWRFISNLTHSSLQTLRRAILGISYRNIHEVIRPVQPAAGYDSSQTSLFFLAPWWCQQWYRQSPYMVVRRNALAICCSAYHNRPIFMQYYMPFFKCYIWSLCLVKCFFMYYYLHHYYRFYHHICD